jgi:hypothetical protein
MARWLLVVLLVTTVVSFAASSSAAAPPGWNTFYAVQQPLSVALPSSWKTAPVPKGAVFNAWNPQTGATLYIFVYSTKLTKSAFFAQVLADAPSGYMEQDPKAVIRTRMVTLPSGKVLELIAELTRHTGSTTDPLWIQNYNVFHNGVSYDIEYAGPPSEDAIDLPVFGRSAETISFTS